MECRIWGCYVNELLAPDVYQLFKQLFIALSIHVIVFINTLSMRCCLLDIYLLCIIFTEKLTFSGS